MTTTEEQSQPDQPEEQPQPEPFQPSFATILDGLNPKFDDEQPASIYPQTNKEQP